MSDFLIMEGDQAIFLPAFGAAIVVVQPGRMEGSGQTTHNGKKICVDGDEANVSVSGCMYMTPQYSIPGVGTLKIDSLADDQLSGKMKSDGKKIILKGNMFDAKFEVSSPAQQPTTSSPIPDSSSQYSGHGQFASTNVKFKVS